VKPFTTISHILLLMTALTSDLYSQERTVPCKEALDKGDNSRAIECYRDVIKKEKRNAAAFVGLGTALLRVDSTDQAIANIIQAREIEPENPKIYLLLGDAYAKQNIFAAAVQQYQRAAELDSTNAQIYLRLARANMKARQYNDAAKTYYKALSLDSNNVDITRELANLMMQAKQYPNAVPLLERLAHMQPDSLGTQFQLVRALSNIKAYDRLIPVAEGVLQKDPGNKEVLSALGEAYVAMKDNANAERVLMQLQQQGGLSAEDLIKLGISQKAQERYDAAIASFEQAYRLDSTNSDIYYDLGTLYMRTKKWPAAVDMFKRKIAADTTSGYRFASHLNIGMSLLQLKDYKQAKEHVLAAIEYRPDNVQAWLTLAQTNALLENVPDQRAAYRKVIELATATTNSNGGEKYTNQLEEAYRMEGFYLLLDKKYAAAIDNFRKALQLDARNCQTMLWLAQAYHNNNDRDDAKKYYCRILELCPKGKEVKDVERGLKLLGVECGN
jgi:tetratricopeptide (TPR) repeat protein